MSKGLGYYVIAPGVLEGPFDSRAYGSACRLACKMSYASKKRYEVRDCDGNVICTFVGGEEVLVNERAMREEQGR